MFGTLSKILGTASPRGMTYDDWKPIIKSALAAWIGFTLILVQPVLEKIGQAGFLVLIYSSAQPPSGPFVKVAYDSVYTLTFVCASWVWWVIASRAATAARGGGMNPADLARADHFGFSCTSTPEQCVSEAIFEGEFVAAGSALVYSFMLCIGVTFYLFIKVRYPARLISTILGLVSLIVSFMTGSLFPYYYPAFTEVVLRPFALQVAIGLLVSALVYPQTMNHAYIRQLRGLVRGIKDLAEAQHDVLRLRVESAEEWQEQVQLAPKVIGLRAALAALDPNDAHLDQELHYSRLRAADLRLLAQLSRDVILKSGGFMLFSDLVAEALARHEEGELITAAHYSTTGSVVSLHQRPASHASTPAITRPPSPSHSAPGDLEMPVRHTDHSRHHVHYADPDEGASQDTGDDDSRPDSRPDSRRPSRDKRKPLRQRLSASRDSTIGLISRSAHNLLHEALHHQYRPVGVFEMRKYFEHQERYPRKLEVEYLLRMLNICGDASTTLFNAVTAALDSCDAYLEEVNKDRFINNTIFRRRRNDMSERLSNSCSTLEQAIEDWRNNSRLKVLAPYESTTGRPLHTGDVPHRPLLRIFYLEFHFTRFAESILKLLKICLELEIEKRTRAPRWHLPSSIVFFHASKGQPRRPIGGNSANAASAEDRGMDDHENYDADEFATEVRDPDADPPRNVFHLIGRQLIRFGRLLNHDQFYFAVRGGILIGLVSLPGFLRRSAGWFYHNRGLWAVIMAAFSIAPFTGDTTFTFVWRIVGTFFGALVGLLIWYIASGSGQGNPYGMSATVAVAVVFLQYVRLRWIFKTPQPAIIFVLTAALVVGYSWQNSHLPSSVNLGWGWPVAWRRFIVVLIGISAAFIWSFLPKPITGRQVLRQRLARGCHGIGDILTQVSNFARERHHLPHQEEVIRSMVTRAQARLIVLNQRLAFVSFEPPLSGPWPKDRYTKMLTTQRELLDLMVTFCNVLVQMDDPRWKMALLKRAGWYDRDLMAGMCSSLFMSGNAIKTGQPLPQLVPNPLLDKFYNRIDQIQEHKLEGSLPQFLGRDILQDRGYMHFAVGSVISFAIIQRVDLLMSIAKALVGEHWSSAVWREPPSTAGSISAGLDEHEKAHIANDDDDDLAPDQLRRAPTRPPARHESEMADDALDTVDSGDSRGSGNSGSGSGGSADDSEKTRLDHAAADKEHDLSAVLTGPQARIPHLPVDLEKQ